MSQIADGLTIATIALFATGLVASARIRLAERRSRRQTIGGRTT